MPFCGVPSHQTIYNCRQNLFVSLLRMCVFSHSMEIRFSLISTLGDMLSIKQNE